LHFLLDFAMSTEIKDDDQVPVEEEETAEKEDTSTPDQTKVSLELPPTDEQPVAEASNDTPEGQPETSELAALPSTDVEPTSSTVIDEKENQPLTTAATESIVETSNSNGESPASEGVQHEEATTIDHQHRLLRLVIDKTNKEASSAILNTVSCRSNNIAHRPFSCS
jgi:hypothetical protein